MLYYIIYRGAWIRILPPPQGILGLRDAVQRRHGVHDAELEDGLVDDGEDLPGADLLDDPAFQDWSQSHVIQIRAGGMGKGGTYDFPNVTFSLQSWSRKFRTRILLVEIPPLNFFRASLIRPPVGRPARRPARPLSRAPGGPVVELLPLERLVAEAGELVLPLQQAASGAGLGGLGTLRVLGVSSDLWLCIRFRSTSRSMRYA